MSHISFELLLKTADLLDIGFCITQVDFDNPGDSVSLYVNDGMIKLSGYKDIKKTVGHKISEAFPDFLKSGIPDQYIHVCKSQKRLDLGEIEYEDDKIKKAVAKLSILPLENDKVILMFVPSRKPINITKLEIMTHDLILQDAPTPTNPPEMSPFFKDYL